MRHMFALLTLLLPLPACAAPNPVDDPIPDHCRDYIKPSGNYDGHIIVTENGEVVADRDGTWFVFQSGGSGTSWAGVIGTAKEDRVDFSYDSQFFQYVVTTEGTATLTDANFTIVYTSPEETLVYVYEITGLVPAANAVSAQTLLEGNREFSR